MSCASVSVPRDTWLDVQRHFTALVLACRDCLRGTPRSCNYSVCPAWKYRSLAARVAAVGAPNRNLARHYIIEQEIIDTLARIARPVTVKSMRLALRCTRWEKSHAVRRLVASGIIVRTQGADGRGLVSLSEQTEKQTERKEHE